MPLPEDPVIAGDAVMITSDSISFSWVLPPGSTGSEVSWRLSGQRRRRRAVRNAEGGSSDRLSGNSYTIGGLRSGTSYDITLTTSNPAGSASATFTRSTAPGGELLKPSHTHTYIHTHTHTHTHTHARTHSRTHTHTHTHTQSLRLETERQWEGL